jgi:hypothetical protein
MGRFTFAAVALSFAIPAFADINLSTGYNSGGTLICSSSATSCTGTDANWSVVENNGFNSGATGSGQAVSPDDPDWYGGWIGNASGTTAASDWIAYDANNCCNNGFGTYTRTFNLTGYDLSTVSISGGWTLDDSGILVLNGKTIGTLGDGNWGSFTPFSDSTSTDFNQGVNTLQIEITDTDTFLEGVNLNGTLTGTQTGVVPEPSNVAIVLIAGFAALLIVARRRVVA